MWNYFPVFCFCNRFAQPYSLKPLHKNHRQLTLDVYLKVYLLSLMRQQLLSMHYFYQFFTQVFLLASCYCWVASVVSDSVWPHRWQPTRLPHPWDSPGKNTGVDCHFLLQCMKVKSESEVAQSCPTLSDPMDCSLPGSSVHGIFQARVLEWGAIAFSGFLEESIIL